MLKIYFAPMEGITDGILRRAHQEIFGGVDVYCLPFHKLTHTLSLTAREKRDIDPEENRGLRALPQALTKDPKRGRGSGMLRDPDMLQGFLDRVFSRPLPVSLSVKTRIGCESADEWPRLLDILAAYPFEHMTIHVRTMKEQYTGAIHPEAFRAAVLKGVPHPVYNGDLRTPMDVSELLRRFPETEAVMIGRGLLADPALARRLRGGKEACAEELAAWYTALYQGWERRFHPTLALGRIKKLMEWPSEGDIRRRRLLRRADGIEGCIRAVLGQTGHGGTDA